MIDWTNKKHILIFRPDNMGDVLMSSPAVRALKHAVSDRKITLFTSNAGAIAADLLSEVDHVIVHDLPWIKGEHMNGNFEQIRADIENTKADAAVIFTVYSQNPQPTALLCLQAGIHDIAAYSRETPYQLISHWIPDREPIYEIKHQVERDLKLAKSLGANISDTAIRLTVPEKARQSIRNRLKANKVVKPFIIIHPGVSEQRRQYPPEKLGNAGKIIIARKDLQLIITGTHQEHDVIQAVYESVGQNAVILDNLPITEFAALISQASLLISNNTGPVHIASGMKTPVVVLYAQTNSQHTPWKIPNEVLYFDVPAEKRSQNILLQYTYENCFRNIREPNPNDIAERALNLLENHSD